MRCSSLFFAVLATSSAFAAIRYVDDTGGADVGDCLAPGSPCLTITYALSVADQGDTIEVAAGDYPEDEIDITLDFITIEGPLPASDPTARTSYAAGCHVAEACVGVSGGGEYIFGIGADNVIIQGLDIVGDPGDTWAGIKILTGGWDRWTIEFNIIEEIDFENTASIFNFSFGIYGDSQTSDGTVSMTGNEVGNNLIFELGGLALAGSNQTAGMGIFLEGIEGESEFCSTLDKFDCGIWVHDNLFDELAIGQNEDNFSFDVNGVEASVGVNIVQDDENSLPNNGALLEDNVYAGDAVDGDMENGVIIGIGDSQVNELNADMIGEVVAYVTNIDRKATIAELLLADFFKTLHPSFFGPGSDIYFEDETEAKDNSDDTATIVHLELTSGPAPDLFKISVEAQGTTASYKVSLDSAGDLNLRQGARLLFDGALSDLSTDGVTEIVLDGTEGNDLLTIDFNNGNPLPLVDPGVDFDGKGGFDKIVLRGDEQVTDQTFDMSGPSSGTIYFEPGAGPDLAPATFSSGTTTSIAFTDLEPIDDLIIVNGEYSIIAPDDTNNEINIINGPFRFGFETFQVNSGQNATFEEINFAN